MEQSRVEELDSDDTDSQGVGLDIDRKRFTSDPLHFTGIDMSSAASRERRRYAYDDTEDSSDSDSDLSEFDGTNALQIALRDKEEALVQSALARIRRAQEKGKRDVKLNQDEIDALEKRRKRMQAAATTRGKGNGSGSGSERRRTERKRVPIPSLEPISRRQGKTRKELTPPPSGGAPPGLLMAGPDGSTTYAPLGYHPSQSTTVHNSPSRPRSSASQKHRSTPPPQYPPYPHGSLRHHSDGARPNSSSSTSSRRPLPDEEGWIPTNSRRSSVASHVDPFEYQTSSERLPAIPPQYMQGRRNVSGPPDIAYSSVRRTPPIPPGGYSSSTRGASDPTIRRRSSRRDDIDELAPSSDDDESDDLGNGVQVYIEEEPERAKPISRKPVGGRKKGKR
ncbi:hypothetical protein B0O99DRAFT_604066 [Bisporella sp. PMI_857]|nr:hypothetical protein B0O99DRAFT_604066 [Bisporella sp. PMI_857]